MRYFSRQTVFDRPADMYIQNNTDKDLLLFNTDLQSGILEVNPPTSIKASEKGYFKGEQSGLVGSSGLLTYTVVLNNLTTYISLYWSHPEGATSSIYYGYSSPFGAFYVTPKNNLDANQKPTFQHAVLKNWITNENSYEYILALNPTGHDQSITYTIQYGLGLL